jgi:NAD(P)-dependent dehydrogenase (short-subunit alcohol dehydrogenase family)
MDMDLRGKKVVVTGGSRGLGLGLVEALVARGAQVTVVARGADDLAAVAARLGVATLAADVTEEAAAQQIVADIRPDVLVLNAGAKPPMARLDHITWEAFSHIWETDVKAGLFWIQAALNTPMAAGSRVLVGSSGAAVAGSQMSGGYGGAKKMLWFMAKYANGVSQERNLGIRFQTIVPRMMILGTGVGDTAAGAYAASMGISPEAFVARFGAPMPPRDFGDRVIAVLEDAALADGVVFGLNGDAGVTIMESGAV